MSELQDILSAGQCPECKRLKAENESDRAKFSASAVMYQKNEYEQEQEIKRLRAALKRIANDPGGHPDEGFPLRQMASEALETDDG